MSILASLNNASLISHEQFLQELYENKWIDGIFDVKTPFMMDEQAKAVVKHKNGGELSKRKRKKKNCNALTEIEQRMISLLKNLQKHFEPIPVDDNIILGTQSFTYLMADLCQDINRGFQFCRCLNDTC